MIGRCSEHLFSKQFSKHLTGGYKDLIFQFTMEKIPEELWTFIGQFLNQEKIIDHLYSRLRLTNENLEHMMNDNISLQHECDLLNQRMIVLERLQLMQQRQNSRLKRKNIILRSRIDVLEDRTGSRRTGNILDRSFGDLSPVSDSDNETVIVEVSDTDEVDV